MCKIIEDNREVVLDCIRGSLNYGNKGDVIYT